MNQKTKKATLCLKWTREVEKMAGQKCVPFWAY